MKGIILAGGYGSRLYPLTSSVSKQLLPVFDKPMIYYPLSVLMLAGIKDILLISTEMALPMFEKLLGDGSQWGISVQYLIQNKPKGLPDAFLVAKEFIANEPVCLILGDNIIYGSGLAEKLAKGRQTTDGALIFAYGVRDPHRYGIVELDENEQPLSLAEKPDEPKSNMAISGLYFFDPKVVRYAEQLVPSARGELEIIDILKQYFQQDKLKVVVFGRGIAWFDAGTHEALLQASNFIYTVQERQGLIISSPDEIAHNLGYIDDKALFELAEKYSNHYGEYLKSKIKGNFQK